MPRLSKYRYVRPNRAAAIPTQRAHDEFIAIADRLIVDGINTGTADDMAQMDRSNKPVPAREFEDVSEIQRARRRLWQYRLARTGELLRAGAENAVGVLAIAATVGVLYIVVEGPPGADEPRQPSPSPGPVVITTVDTTQAPLATPSPMPGPEPSAR